MSRSNSGYITISATLFCRSLAMSLYPEYTVAEWPGKQILWIFFSFRGMAKNKKDFFEFHSCPILHERFTLTLTHCRASHSRRKRAIIITLVLPISTYVVNKKVGKTYFLVCVVEIYSQFL